jgi:predicted helicase
VIPSAAAARVLYQIAAETQALRDALSTHTSSADEFAQSLAALFVASQGQVQTDEAIALIESTVGWVSDPNYVAGFLQRVSKLSLNELNDQLTAQMGDAGPYCVEALLAAYDRSERRARGVYFTPLPIVRFLVRAAERLVLPSRSIDEGLTAIGRTALRVVDPACGSGVFLREVLRSPSAGWSEPHGRQITRHCLGFEVLPANAVAAKWLLSRASYRPDNCCSGAPQILAMSALSAVSESVLDRLGAGPLVVIGNPPYANFGRRNRDPWLLKLLRDYWDGLGERKHNLHDDYVKFFRWAEHHITRAGSGVLALITNHAYASGITHRVMRRHLQQTFDRIYILDLGGRIARGSMIVDENIFGIRTGVAISLLVRSADRRRDDCATVHYAALKGSRVEKLAALAEMSIDTIEWSSLRPSAPSYWFAPDRTSQPPHPYRNWPAVDEIFEQFVSGVQTKNDELFVDFDRPRLAERMQNHFDALSKNGQGDVVFDAQNIRPYTVAPLDKRWIYYEPRLLGRARFQVMQHMLQDNFGLVFMRQSTNEGPYDHFLVVRDLVSDRVFYSVRGAPFLAPLWLYDGAARRANLRAEFLDRLARVLNHETDVSDVLAYIYGVFHDRLYRVQWHEWLKLDFPRVPLPRDRVEFHRFSQVGKKLIDIHAGWVSDSTSLERRRTRLGQPSDWRIARGCPRFVSNGNGFGELLINDTCGFSNVPVSAWEMRIGGYPVLQRWLKQRCGRFLDAMQQDYVGRVIDILASASGIAARVG